MQASALVSELEPVAGRLLDRHLASAREWFPHELIPYERGRAARPGAWTEADADLGGASLPEAVRSSLYVNLLTEDNLPYYLRDIHILFGGDDAWGAWARRWTAEEGRHSMAIYGYLMVTRAVDPVALERGRMCQVSTGQVPAPVSAHDGLVYLTLQELATRIAHRNTGKMLGDPVGYELMARVASDENLHHLFYRDAVGAALERHPDATVLAIEAQARHFAMPGTGMAELDEHAPAIADAGIYSLATLQRQVLSPVLLGHWRLDHLDGLSPDADAARRRTLRFLERLGRLADRVAAVRSG